MLVALALASFLLASTASAAGRRDETQTLRATTAPAITQFSVGETSINSPSKVVAGPDGNLWFIDDNRNGYGKITPSGAVTEWTWDNASDGINRGVTELAAGPDGNVWYTLCPGGGLVPSIARLTPAGVFTGFTANGYGHNFQGYGCPGGITAGPDGNMWFTDGNYVGKITMGGQITEYDALPSNDNLGNIVAGPDGDLWATATEQNRIAQISTGGAVVKLYQLATDRDRGPESIVVGPDHNLWFTEVAADLVGKLTTGGALTEYPIPTGGFAYAGDSGITAGPDGNLWFTECASGGVGKITTSGVVTDYFAGSGLQCPDGIAAGSDGNIWFADMGAGKIDRVSAKTTPPPTTPTPTPTPTPAAHTASVVVRVVGKGSVVGSGISCPRRCTKTFSGSKKTTVVLHATAAPGYRLAAWTGACPAATWLTTGLLTANQYRTCTLAKIQYLGDSIWTWTNNVGVGGPSSGTNLVLSVTAKFVKSR